jgi:hypothetical protein
MSMAPFRSRASSALGGHLVVVASEEVREYLDVIRFKEAEWHFSSRVESDAD